MRWRVRALGYSLLWQHHSGTRLCPRKAAFDLLSLQMMQIHLCAPWVVFHGFTLLLGGAVSTPTVLSLTLSAARARMPHTLPCTTEAFVFCIATSPRANIISFWSRHLFTPARLNCTHWWLHCWWFWHLWSISNTHSTRELRAKRHADKRRDKRVSKFLLKLVPCGCGWIGKLERQSRISRRSEKMSLGWHVVVLTAYIDGLSSIYYCFDLSNSVMTFSIICLRSSFKWFYSNYILWSKIQEKKMRQRSKRKASASYR